MFALTVGNSRADLNGTDQRVIQAAVDTVARMGGGTVKLLPGTFRLRNAVYLSSNLRLVGSGPDTVLVKEASAASKLAADAFFKKRRRVPDRDLGVPLREHGYFSGRS